MSNSKASLEPIQVQEAPSADENKEQEQKEGTNQSPGKNTNADWDKKIIKTAVMNVETQEFKNYSRQIHALLTKWEGYIAREEESESEGKLNNLLSIKVPASRFDEAVNSISSLNGKVLVKQISSEDVTGEIMDVRTRAEAKKRIRLRYLEYAAESQKHRGNNPGRARDQPDTGTDRSRRRKTELPGPHHLIQHNRTHVFPGHRPKIY
jgi:hypothetical protein